jgi:membrane-bound serine protease (ClpP class)
MAEVFLLNPNVVYLALVAAMVLTIMAILTPGTGIFEIGALFAYVLAGWGMFVLTINLWALGLLVVGVFPFLLLTRRTGNRAFLVISLASLAIGSAYLLQGEPAWLPAANPALAVFVSALMSAAMWLVTVKVLELESLQPSHDLRRLIGEVGRAETEIHQEGSAQIARELWSVRSETPIPKGAPVRVVDREGLILIVEQAGVGELTASPSD